VLPDEAGHHLAVRGYGADGRILIFAHKAAVALDIGTDDSGELTFKALCVHGITPEGFESGRTETKDISAGYQKAG